MNSTIIFPLPFDCPIEHPKNLAISLQSGFHVRDEVPYFHQLSIEWDADAINNAIQKVREILDHWQGDKSLQFVIFFTHSAQEKLIEIASLKYWLENHAVQVDFTDCFPELRQALEEIVLKKPLPFQEPHLAKTDDSHISIVIQATPLKIHSLILKRHFKDFENPLDRPPKIFQYDFSLKQRFELLPSIASILQEVLLHQKENEFSFKVRFTLSFREKLQLQTTRVQGLLRLKVKIFNDSETDQLLQSVVDIIQEHSFQILKEV